MITRHQDNRAFSTRALVRIYSGQPLLDGYHSARLDPGGQCLEGVVTFEPLLGGAVAMVARLDGGLVIEATYQGAVTVEPSNSGDIT